MKFRNLNKLLSLFLFLALICNSSVSYRQIHFNSLLFSNFQYQKKSLNKHVNYFSKELTKVQENTSISDFEDDNLEEDDNNILYTSLYKCKIQSYFSNALKKFLSKNTGVTSIPLFILYCTLKIPFIF